MWGDEPILSGHFEGMDKGISRILIMNDDQRYFSHHHSGSIQFVEQPETGSGFHHWNTYPECIPRKKKMLG
jgi:hypothetical protein